MKARIACFLDLPLRFRDNGRSILRYAGAFSLFILLFLSFYQPFFISHLSGYELWGTNLVIAGFTCLCILLNHLLVAQNFGHWMARWNLRAELIWSFFHFLLIGCFNILWVRFYLQMDIQAMIVLGDTAFVGIIPVGMDLAMRIRSQKGKTESPELLYVMSDGNYVHIFQSEGEDLRREVVRCPLYKVKDDSSGQLVQIHKRYLVNAEAIKAVKGNSNGGHVILCDDSHVPYSRRFYLQVRKLAS